MVDVHLRSACLYEAGCTGCLTPGASTINHAAVAFGVSVHRVLVILRDTLTDVYTPDGDEETDGLGGVIAEHGRTRATVSTRLGTVHVDNAGRLLLASDSVAALHQYLGKRAGAR